MQFTAGYEGGASQFGGGGFIASPAPGGDAAASSTPSKRSNNNNSTLRCLTIRQIYEGTKSNTDDKWVIDGAELHNISLVGKITSVQEQETHISINLDDGTGKIEMKFFLDSGVEESDELNERKAEWRVGVYVRAFGHLRSLGGKKCIYAFHIRAIHDNNEVTYHHLQAIFESAYLLRGPPSAACTSNGAFNPGKPAPAMLLAAGGDPYGASGASGLTPVQQAVYEFFKSHAGASDSGHSTDSVLSAVRQYPGQQVREAIEFLKNDGHIYSTIDDDHHKAAFC